MARPSDCSGIAVADAFGCADGGLALHKEVIAIRRAQENFQELLEKHIAQSCKQNKPSMTSVKGEDSRPTKPAGQRARDMPSGASGEVRPRISPERFTSEASNKSSASNTTSEPTSPQSG